MNNSPPSIRPALKNSQGAVSGLSPTPKNVSFHQRLSYGGKSPRRANETFRSSQLSVNEVKLESELLREAVDALFKAVNASGGMNSKSLDSLYDILCQIIVNPYIDDYRLLDLGQFKSKFARYPEATKLLNEIGFI